jgi:hypothetical protein
MPSLLAIVLVVIGMLDILLFLAPQHLSASRAEMHVNHSFDSQCGNPPFNPVQYCNFQCNIFFHLSFSAFPSSLLTAFEQDEWLNTQRWPRKLRKLRKGVGVGWGRGGEDRKDGRETETKEGRKKEH